MKRYTSTGNNRPHVVHGGYQYQPRNDGSRFERPAGEPSLAAGVGLLLIIAVAVTLAIVAIGGAA